MPGLFGAIHVKPEDHGAETLNTMALRMRHHSWYRRDDWSDPSGQAALGRISLGFGETGAQPATNEAGTVICLVSGEIHETPKHRQELEKAGRRLRSESAAELVLHGYTQEGSRFFAKLEGIFAAALWDRQRQRLVLVNDRFGIKPLYYVHLPGKLLFASEIKALLADPQVPRSLAARGIVQFFTFGQLLGEDTFFAAVRLLPAASCLTFDLQSDRLSLERYWQLRSQERIPADQALERIDAAFCQAVARRTEEATRLGISLSGGLDARTILAVMDTAKTPVTAVSMGIPGSMDLDSAARMAELTHSPFHACILQDAFLSQYERHLREMVWQTDGHYLSECVVRPTLPTYRELGIEKLLRGHAGELMHLDKAYNYSLRPEALAVRSEVEGQAWLWEHLRTLVQAPAEAPIFTPAYQREAEALARDSLEQCWQATAGIEPFVHRIAALFVQQRSRRETALSMVEFGTLVEPRLPYLDRELVEALLAAPPELKIGDAIQQHLLRRHRPDFLKVVNANTGTIMGAGPVRRFLAKARLKVFSKLGIRGYQPYERIGLWLRRELQPLVREVLLSKRCQERGILNPAGVRTVIEQHGSKQHNHTYLLLALMIFEMGQRIFLDGESVALSTTAAAA